MRTYPQLTESLEESIVLTLFDLVNHMTKNGELMSGAVDLTVQQWNVLLQVAGDPAFPRPSGRVRPQAGVTASAIARTRGVSKAHVSALVSTLLKKGMLVQVEEPRDRRLKRLRLTAKGGAALAKIEPNRRQANRALFADLTRQELASTLAILRSCLERLCRASSTPGTREAWSEDGHAPSVAWPGGVR